MTKRKAKRNPHKGSSLWATLLMVVECPKCGGTGFHVRERVPPPRRKKRVKRA